MSQYSATPKNPPWARNTVGSVGLGQSGVGGPMLTPANQNLAAVVAAQTQQAANQQAASTFNQGLAALGLQNALQQNAMQQNALQQNALQQNALQQNALQQNALQQNALQQNALQQQQNALQQNALQQNALQQNALQQNALTPTAVISQAGIALPAASLATNVTVGTPGLALPTTLATTLATVSYPAPRLMGQNPGQYSSVAPPPQASQTIGPPQHLSSKQRVFTGTITKLHDNFGFVDEDVFFQTSAVKGSMPNVGDRVLVEASYNPSMPFKWNATRIQLLPNQLNVQSPLTAGRSVMTVSMPVTMTSQGHPVAGHPVGVVGSGNVVTMVNSIGSSSQVPFVTPVQGPRIGGLASVRRHSPPAPSSIRRERDNRGREERRERYREPRKRSRSPKRNSRSPPRRRQKVLPRYNVQIPKISLDMPLGCVLDLRKRYNNLYIPSDFFCAQFLWQQAFPADRPFGLDHPPASFHVLHKDVQPQAPNDAVLEPADADHLFSAKVMLLSLPGVQELHQRACALAEEGSLEEPRESFVHPTRLIHFLVGLKGKNETVAIGGPWSPSLDGPNPDKDPAVLIKTAIRTCKALTGIDLSPCMHWYRFAEIHYRRGESSFKSRGVPKRVETSVIFLPDIWSCMPTRLEWDALTDSYKKQLQRKLQLEEVEDYNDTQEDEEGNQEESAKKEPSHHSELDPKTMKVADLRNELEARSLNARGLKSQLIARLTKALKSESDREEEQLEQDAANQKASGMQDDQDKDSADKDNDGVDEEKKKKEEEEKRLKEERERQAMEKRYVLPECPSILVHPSTVAKGGKFDCSVISLSVLLDYRQEDNKEHSFEVSLFAELFNEMLMRDFGFAIYQALVEAPEAKEDEKDKKKDKKDDKKDDKNDKKDRRKDDDEASDDEDDEDEDLADDKDKKKKKPEKKQQMVTVNPWLLLAFVYFDQNHCGYIMEKDLEELLYILGLHLSRSQVRKILQKVIKKEMLHYRKLTDRLQSEVNEKKEEEGSKNSRISLKDLAAGNKRFLPIFKMPGSSSDSSKKKSPSSKAKEEKEKETSEKEKEKEDGSGSEPLVLYKGALLDVDKLLQQLRRSEKARADTEEKMREMQEELDEMREAASISEQNALRVTGEFKEQSKCMKSAEEDLRLANISLEKYQRALAVCRDQLHLLLCSVESAMEGAPSSCSFVSNPRKPFKTENHPDTDT